MAITGRRLTQINRLHVEFGGCEQQVGDDEGERGTSRRGNCRRSKHVLLQHRRNLALWCAGSLIQFARQPGGFGGGAPLELGRMSDD